MGGGVKQVSKYYEFLSFYQRAEKFYSSIMDHKNRHFKNHMAEDYDKKDIRDEIIITLKPIYKKEAKQIIDELKINIDYIKEWRSFLADNNLINESHYSSKIKKAYIKALDANLIIGAEEVNYMIFILNFFLNILTNEKNTVKNVIGNLSYKHCVICGANFKSNKDVQITCGNKFCINENKNRAKKLLRKRK